MQGSTLLPLKEVVRATGQTPRTIRFYEEAGLLEPASRSRGGHRLYRAADLERLRFICDLRIAGLSLEEIREVLGARGEAAGVREGSRRVRELLTAHIEQAEQRLEALRRLRAELSCTFELLSPCVSCPGTVACADCEQVVVGRDLPRAFRALWGLGS